MKKKRHWLWNLLIILTLVVCCLAFASHSKNWMKLENDRITVLSGFYYKELPFADLDSVQLVEHLPPMERLNGFSAFGWGKGVYREFKDSLTDEKVYVYLDNFPQKKIKLVYQDSLLLFLNLRDSVDTQNLLETLQEKLPKETIE